MKRRDLVVILLGMVVIAAGAILVNHYAFAHESLPPITTTTTDSLAKSYRACVADGATIETAIAAFKAENPDLNPTESTLISGGLGGPYLQSWAYNPRFYSFSLMNGVLYLHAGTSGFLTALPSTRFRFTGPSSCLKIGL